MIKRNRDDDTEIDNVDKRNKEREDIPVAEQPKATFTSRRKTQINTSNNEGMTALHCAAQAGNLAIVKVLLNCDDCLINAQDKKGRTPLTLVIETKPPAWEAIANEIHNMGGVMSNSFRS